MSIVPFAVATAIALVILWPQRSGGVEVPGAPVERLDATVTRVQQESCEEIPGAGGFNCSRVTVRLDEGPDEGEGGFLQLGRRTGG